MEDNTVLPVREKNDLSTYQITYTDARGQIITEFIEAKYIMTRGNHIDFNTGSKSVLMIDQRAMHSCRNVSELDMKE